MDVNPALTHIALHVSDFEACITFYEGYCGMRVCHRRSDDHSRVVWLAELGKEKDFIIVGDMNIEGIEELKKSTPEGFLSLNDEVATKLTMPFLCTRMHSASRTNTTLTIRGHGTLTRAG